LTKGVPIEGTALLAREFSDYLRKASSEKDPVLNETELEAAQRFLYTPGISVVRDAQIATRAGKVHAMHDPTESGLSGALWELADASHRCLVVDRGAVYVPPLARRICNAFGIDPLATIASGALLLAVDAGDSANIQAALRAEDIACDEIGSVINGPAGVWLSSGQTLQRPIRDDIARVFEEIERDQ
jgi:hydrogenase maturation factor